MNMDIDGICDSYKSRSGARVTFLLIAAFLLFVAAVTGLSVGASGESLAETLKALVVDTGRLHTIIWMLRLPRVIMAILVGFGLGLAGSVFQAILRNPLASPYTLGIGSGAGFGAVTMLIFFGADLNRNLVPLGAFGFSLVCAFFILAIARAKRATPETMILAGIALMFLFSSLTSLFQYMGTMEQVNEIVFWFFGSLSKAGWPEIGMAALMILLPAPILLRSSWDLNLLTAGDETARSLGVNVDRLRLASLVIASLITAGSICFTGVIGFVGLVAPHITRMIIGTDHRFLLPGSGLVGAVVVLVADTLGRTMWAPQVLPIGIVTSFIGVPFFFYLLMRRSKEYW